MKPRTVLVASLSIGMIISAATPLKVASITLEKLTRTSDLIVLATITAVDQLPEREKVATATVEGVWKGEPIDTVKFRAHRTWTCDISKATEGERVALFLTAKADEGYRHICHSGRGRMPIIEKEGTTYLAIWSADVRVPKGTPWVRWNGHPESLFSFTNVEAVVRATVQKQLDEELSGDGQ